MIHEVSRRLVIVGGLSLILTGVGCTAIEAGHEGVLVEQPFFFGHGGVDPVPARSEERRVGKECRL